ncbi:Cytochrome P450 [Arthroderma uncinatum]|uniref:Cytochrome P450 n=1 Tax=Arthroderma uncinatum TaxID=74035 RepID=UPI00144A881A|nr:Cytochrome P450 [Arthroderma uncinatum]KAF3483874.1 Cytochrome P450 [Arthroderma uncinatum]
MQQPMDTNAPALSLAPLLLCAVGLYVTIVVVYQLWLSPLAGVPGPRVAAVTRWYEFYWECIKLGRYTFRIEDMHKRYGPVVRISPREVHIDDPAFWDVLYTNSKLDKDAWYYRPFEDNYATVGTVSWRLHRQRRGAMAKFFSKANVSALEPQVMAVVKRLCGRIEEHRISNKVVDISNAYRCFATDVITNYAAPQTIDFISTPDFAAAYNRVLRDFSYIMLWHRQFPFVFPLLATIPRWVISMIDSSGATLAVIDNQARIEKQAKAVIETKGMRVNSTPTVLDAVYTCPVLGPEQKSLRRLTAEAATLIGAGTETTGNTLSVFTFHVLSNPYVLKQVTMELAEAAKECQESEFLDYRTLKGLPYFQACIKEALRIGTGVSGRLPRVNPSAPTSYTTPAGKTYIFPANTAISMSIRDIHANEEIFPQPHCFMPERWLDSSQQDLWRMEKAFVPFSGGHRGCLGLELAKLELNLLAGNLLHKFRLELFETTEWDISVQHDFFAPFGPTDSKGVRLIVKE